MKKMHKYYTITGLAKDSGVSGLTIAYKIATKEIPAITAMRGHKYIAEEDALRFIEKVKAHRRKQLLIAL